MELAVHGKQIDVGDALRTHVEAKIEDLNSKYFNHTTFATVTFSKEGHGHARTKAHISIKLGKNIMRVAASTDPEPYAAFDAASEKAAKQLRRYKRRLRDHHEHQEQTPESENAKAMNYVIQAMPESINDDEEDSAEAGTDPLVIAEMSSDIETMAVADAVMRLDLSDEPVLMFRNGSNNGINVVYKRKDGNIGWIDPRNEKGQA